MESTSTEVTFLWYVENYSFSSREILISPVFTADKLEKTAWVLAMYPRGHRDVVKGFVSLYFHSSLGNGRHSISSVKYELSIVAEDGSVLASEEDDYSFQSGLERGSLGFFKMDESLYRRNFPQDFLTVRCRLWREEEVQKAAPISARTRIGIEHISFFHVVENFSKLISNQKDTIKIPSHLGDDFLVSRLYFTDDSCPAEELVIEILPCSGFHTLCKQRISLLGSENKILCVEDDNRFDAGRRDITRQPLSVTRKYILNKKYKYLPNDTLTLSCECSFYTGVELNEIEKIPSRMFAMASKPAHIQKPAKNIFNADEAYPNMMEDIKSFYMSEFLTDVKLKTETKSFPAHKLVLCSRSPVFNRMLTTNMKERNTTCIEVDDLSNDVVEQLLLFLYSDAIKDLDWTMATQLYYAADKYEVGRLKAVCSSFLVEHLTLSNTVNLLLLADTHSDADLKGVVEKFILEHDREVFGSEEWEMLLKTNSQLAGETMHLKYKRKRIK